MTAKDLHDAITGMDKPLGSQVVGPYGEPMDLTQASKPAPIRFTVIGTPRPQGSMKPFFNKHTGRASMYSQIKGLKPWRQEISGSAMALGASMFEQHVPVGITLRFYFRRPKGASQRKRPGMTTAPDGDKLLRAVLDSLKGILVYDDAQFVKFDIGKEYGQPARVEIELRKVEL